MFAKNLLEKNKGQKFLFDVVCSRSLPECINQLGGVLKFCRVGHSFMKKAVKNEGAVLAGEISGHYYFSDSFGYDDGIFSAAKMLEIMSKQNSKMSEIIDSFPKYESTPETRIPYPDEKKFDLVKRLVDVFKSKSFDVVTVDGARVEFPDGWGLVRASNTEPKICLRFEAKTRYRLIEIQSEVMGEFEKEALKDGINI
jgi:phosphomannomutase/phosphoglucomutase